MICFSSLDKGYVPIEYALREYERRAACGEPFSLSVIRSDTERFTVHAKIVEPESAETVKYVERILKGILYTVGGYAIRLAGDTKLIRIIQNLFSKEGARAFDVDFMSKVYGRPFEVEEVTFRDILPTATQTAFVGGKRAGCRIGFDAGGSDRKVAAVKDGEVVYMEEVVWFPKLNENPEYHLTEITAALKTAAEKLPQVDSVGVSTAGIVVNNQMKIASLFIRVPDELWDESVKNIYADATRALGKDIPVTVANDGDVTALAGALSIGGKGVLGIAMGTSEATGYYNAEGGLNGWLNELAFVPVDYNEKSMKDEWCGDYGCGVKYFSQDGVIKLAAMQNLRLSGTPAEQLKEVQRLAENGDGRARKIFATIGVYLGHTLPYYARFYDVNYLLLLGRVMSGIGGDIIIDEAKRVIEETYPELKKVQIITPDEKMRRLGQAVTAATL